MTGSLPIASAHVRWAERKRKEYTQERNAGIRRAYSNGVTVAQLVKITGLSRAHLQRILDLSRDGGAR